jgi:hypothetical protein
MSPVERLQRWRTEVVVARTARACVWGSAAGVLTAMLLGFTNQAATPVALGVATCVVVALLRPWRAWIDLQSLALWLEREVPALRYALVTRLESATGPFTDALDVGIAAVPFERVTRPRLWRPLLPAVGALASLLLASVFVDRVASSTGRTTSGREATAPRRAPRVIDALARYTVTVAPPAYTGRREAVIESPARVAAIAGSRVEIRGVVGDSAVKALIGSRPMAVDTIRGVWRSQTAVGESPVLVTLVSGSRQRTLLIEPVADSLPRVTLKTPARDTVLRAATGTVSLTADWYDDFGLRDGWFDVVISSGEGESFTFRTLTLSRVSLGGRRSGAASTGLSLDSLSLTPGDLVSIRAVARDAGPAARGIAASDTRTLRIARPGEYDSVAVDGAPPPDPLKGLLSQRLLIQLTESLIKRSARIDRATMLVESRRIGRDQAALRRQVGNIVFQRLEDLGEAGEHSHDDGHDHGAMTPEQLLAEAREATSHSGEALDFAGGESPVVAINRPLLEAYNAMWDAGTSLSIGEPRAALPHMLAALAAIQRARAADRVYLRGRPKDIIVDIAKVRLAGTLKDLGPDRRTPRDDRTSVERERLARFDAAVTLFTRDADRALSMLLLLRAELLETSSSAAAALAEAVDAIRGPTDATRALLAARRALGGERRAPSAVGAWSVVP